jgi:hypothetical protein
MTKSAGPKPGRRSSDIKVITTPSELARANIEALADGIERYAGVLGRFDKLSMKDKKRLINDLQQDLVIMVAVLRAFVEKAFGEFEEQRYIARRTRQTIRRDRRVPAL